MRYLALAAAAFAAMTTAASADELTVATGPTQLSEVQLDDVTAGAKRHKHDNHHAKKPMKFSKKFSKTTIKQDADVYQAADGYASVYVKGKCYSCSAVAVGGINDARVSQSAR